MPCIPRGETATDSKGVVIHPGDILERTDLNISTYPWRYFGVYDEGVYGVIVRDFNAHNRGMCELGLEGNVINLGNFKEKDNLQILINEYQLDYILDYNAEANYGLE